MEIKLSTFSDVEESIRKSEESQAAQDGAQNPEGEKPPVENSDTVQPDNGDASVDDSAEDKSSSNLSFDIDGVEPEAKPDTQSQQQAATFNWKDEIKKVDRKELLKEAGLSDFALELDEYMAKGGKPSDYLGARAVDYNQIGDDELVKSELKKTFPSFTKEEVEMYFNSMYGVDEDMSDSEKSSKLIKLKADAHLQRQKLIQEQQQFKIPEAVIPQIKDEAYEQWKQSQQTQQQQIEQMRTFFESHEATKALNESKKVTVSLGENVPPFNFNVDRPDIVTRAFTDGGEIWSKLTTTKTGEPDVAKQQLAILFMANPQKFMQDIFNYGLSRGVTKVVEEGQNAQRPQAKVLPVDSNQKPTYGVGKFADKSR